MNRREVIRRTAWMTGIALSAPVMSGILAGCEAEGEPGWLPEFMSEEQAKTAGELAEAILPKTEDSPGAKEVHVVEFMDKLVKECSRPKDQANFLKGLDEANVAAQSKYSKAIYELTDEERHDLVSSMDKQAYADLKEINKNLQPLPLGEERDYDPRPFFIQFKQLTIAGYFSSKEVGTNVLAYDSIPGAFDGCMDYPNEEVKTAWAI